jgi:hypothetical protein
VDRSNQWPACSAAGLGLARYVPAKMERTATHNLALLTFGTPIRRRAASYVSCGEIQVFGPPTFVNAGQTREPFFSFASAGRADREGDTRDVEWTELRNRWEYSHVVRAALSTASLIALVIAIS